jgi:hypothetical protein
MRPHRRSKSATGQRLTISKFSSCNMGLNRAPARPGDARDERALRDLGPADQTHGRAMMADAGGLSTARPVIMPTC